MRTTRDVHDAAVPAALADRERLRLLLVVPFPPRQDMVHGGRVVAQLLARLATRHEVGVVYLRGPREPGLEPEVAAACGFVQEVVRDSDRWPGHAWRHRWHVVSGGLAGMPTQTRTVGRAFSRAVADACRTWRPDVIQFEHNEVGHVAGAVADEPVVRILVCHEPGLLAARDQASRTRGRQRLAHRVEMRSWRRYWDRGLHRFDAIVCFSEADRDLMTHFAPSGRVVVVPLGIELGDAPLDPVGHGDEAVCLIGNYKHPPNADAALRLIRSIMPAVRRRIPGRRLEIVGARPTRQMLGSATELDRVTGLVEDVTPFQDAAALLALPIRMGGGMRVKLLEALAAGKAIVASPLAAAGIDVTSGSELVLAESDEEFAAAIVRLLEDPEERRRLAGAARAWAVRELSWEPRVAQYEALYRSLLARAG